MKEKDKVTRIVNWIQEQLRKSKLETLVIGVSGGVDSGLVSTLCARTGAKTIVVNMPIHQAKNQQSNADTHINWLKSNYTNVDVCTVDLTKAFDSLKESLPAEEAEDSLAMANTRSRLRMTTLYAIANHHKGLVVGTGNKVEDIGIGFFTKYGDGGVDISPIGDLMKSEVRSMSRLLGLPTEITEAVPTDGLWDEGLTDEDQIGASYDELEWAMNVIANQQEDNFNSDFVMSLTPRQQEILKIYKTRHEANKHKMQPIPVCYML